MSNKIKEGRATPRTCHESLPGESFTAPAPERWSKKIRPREDLRALLGCLVEVLAIYGRKRQFIVGADSDGNLIEITGKEWIWCESEYATIRVLQAPKFAIN
jgi:hypothetical protein